MKKKKLKYLILFIFLILPLSLTGLIFYCGFWLSPQDNLTKADAIVVISGGETEARTREGIRLFKKEMAPYLIFSGAAEDEKVSNALVMKRLALKQDVPESAILLDEKSENTYENAKYVKDILDAKKVKRIILITSPYHQRRAKITFEAVLKSDYVIINHSAVDSTWRKSLWWRNAGSLELTLQEIYRILYIRVTGNYA